MISEDQKRAFAEYGFLVLEDFLTGDEVRESALACDERGRQAADWEFSKEDFNLEAPVGRVHGQDGKRRSYTGVIRAVHYIEQYSPWFAELPHRKRLEEDVIQSLLDTQSTHYLSGIHCNKPARVGSGLDLLHFSGELFGQLTANRSNLAGLLKPSAEWRRTGL